MATPKKPHDHEEAMMSRLAHALILVVVGTLLLVSVAPILDRLIAVVTPLIVVVGVLAIVWKLTQFFTRR
jgi:uncharacterized membrane protein